MASVEVAERNETEFLVDELRTDLHKKMDAVFEGFDVAPFAELVNEVLASEGAIFLSGVGKSGAVAQKIAMTLSSAGVRSMFLSPQNALHGDIGVVQEGDMVFLFSKSGETAELLDLCPALKNKGARVIAVVMNRSSRLAKACGRSFTLPDVQELCPFGLAPTTSTMGQLVFGDLLAVALMRLKGLSLSDFIKNHPAGRIGRRHLLKVQDMMITGGTLPLCSPSDSLGDVLVTLSNKRCGCLCITDGEENLLGIFTDGDLRRALQKLGPASLGLSMGSLMNPTPKTTRPGVLLSQALTQMEADRAHPITVLPVVEEERRCVGLVRLHDILQAGI